MSHQRTTLILSTLIPDYWRRNTSSYKTRYVSLSLYNYGSSSFLVSSVELWNSLPCHIVNVKSLINFKALLHSFLSVQSCFVLLFVCVTASFSTSFSYCKCPLLCKKKKLSNTNIHISCLEKLPMGQERSTDLLQHCRCTQTDSLNLHINPPHVGSKH